MSFNHRKRKGFRSVTKMPPKQLTVKPVAQTSAGRAPHSDVEEDSSSDQQLHGRYKKFFAPEHHATVLSWFTSKASPEQKKDFKRFVKEILDFDFETKRLKLATTMESNIPEASAIVRQNNGHLLLADIRERAVLYVSFASRADKQRYRQCFGHICGFSSFHGQTQMKCDFSPELKFMKSERGHLVDRSSEVIGASKLKAPSQPFEAPCEIIGSGKTAYSTMFAWKVSPKTGVNIQQRAHESTFKGAPWGLYGDESNREQWVPHSVAAHDDIKFQFDEAELRDKLKDPNGATLAANTGMSAMEKKMAKPGQFRSAPAEAGGPKRFIGQQRFQNYNENFCEMMLKLEKDQQREERREKKRALGTTLPPLESSPSA